MKIISRLHKIDLPTRIKDNALLMSAKTETVPDYVFSQVYVPDNSDMLYFSMRKYPEIFNAIEGMFSKAVQQALQKTFWIQEFPVKSTEEDLTFVRQAYQSIVHYHNSLNKKLGKKLQRRCHA